MTEDVRIAAVCFRSPRNDGLLVFGKLYGLVIPRSGATWDSVLGSAVGGAIERSETEGAAIVRCVCIKAHLTARERQAPPLHFFGAPRTTHPTVITVV